MTDHFSELPWFLREYVHESRWSSFRDIQTQAFDIFRRGDDHILISAGTSSGKTEAAMFPVITSLYNNPPDSIGALYIGPLKALIDDQFRRMDPILRDSGIRITGWHGESSKAMKDRLIREPSGILQITPESLQNMITDRPEDIRRLFGGLRFVVIDEVHAFMDSERGLQLQCCLQRLELLARCDPRRIGLSATISDPQAAAEWLAADTGRHTSVVLDPSAGKRKVTIHYDDIPNVIEVEDPTERKKAVTAYYKRLYKEVRGKDCIVFVNSRSDAEVVGRSLRIVAERYGQKDGIHVHHGSISKEFRHAAEEALKSPDGNATVVATVTLELGIDIGGLDEVVQIEPPLTCSSMVQRMGRSGRRGNAQSMSIMCYEDRSKWWSSVDGVYLDLVKAIAMTQLTVEDGFTEEPEKMTLPYGLLYHQTLEYLKPGVGARFSMLVSDVLSMHPFRNISRDDYKVLLRHMVSIEHLIRMEDGTLLIGPKAEKVAFDRDFCSVFSVRKEIDVVCEGKTVGSVQDLPEVGELIQLAGRGWEVVKIRNGEMTVDVAESDGTASNPWRSGTPGTDTAVMRRMRDILLCDDDYDYIDDAARNRLALCRAMARANGMLELTSEDDGTVRVRPWLGTVQFDTLRRIIRNIDGVTGMYSFQPHYIDVRTEMSGDELISEVEDFLEDGDRFSLIQDNDRLHYGKYDRYVPDVLLMKQFVADRLDCGFELRG